MTVLKLLPILAGVFLLSAGCALGASVPENDAQMMTNSTQKTDQPGPVNCSKLVCLNGGVCRPHRKTQRLVCKCPPAFIGHHCERKNRITRTSNEILRDRVAKMEKNIEQLYRKYDDLVTRIKGVRQVCRGVIGTTFLSVDLDQEIDSGHLVDFSYRKKRNSTLLKIIGNFGHRTSGLEPNAFACTRWNFRIDGHQCTDPTFISALAATYVATTSNNIDRRMHMEAFCRATTAGPLLAGAHTVSLWLGGCGISGTQVGDASTGWRSPSTFSVEEHCPHKA